MANQYRRRTGWLTFTWDEEKRRVIPPQLHCPHGHRIPWEYAFHEAGFPRCHKKLTHAGGSDHGGECGARLFVRFFPSTPSDHRSVPLMFVAEMTEAELIAIFENRMGTYEVMEFLGIVWKPSEDPSAEDAVARIA